MFIIGNYAIKFWGITQCHLVNFYFYPQSSERFILYVYMKEVFQSNGET